MAEAVILGSGTSNGVPSLGIQYTPEFLANPKNHRYRPSMIFLGEDGNVLIDCPPELRLQLVREDIKRVDAVIVTHTHADHVMGMDDLRAFCLLTKRSMPVYTTPEYQQDIKRIFRYAFDDNPTGEVPRFEMHDAPENLELCGMSFQILVVMHGPIPVLAIRCDDFAYVTDVSYIPPEAMLKLKGVRTLILDAVRYRPHKNHFHYEAAIAVAREIGAEQTYFTHLSHDYDHDKTNAELPSGIQLAYDGLRIPL